MIKTKLIVHSKEPFSLASVIYSHGWYDLLPFRVLNSPTTLHYTTTINNNVVDISINESKKNSSSITVTSFRQIGIEERKYIQKTVKDILRLNETFAEFYSAIQPYSNLKWVKQKRAGRLLRSATLFEDIIKIICTTNCSWALTLIMVTNLCKYLGNQSPSGHYGFPDPETIASQSESYLREKIKLGYRAPYVLEFAQNVAFGKLDIESWRYAEIPTEELQKMVLSVKGIGPYAAAHILKLIGRYDYLGIDSWSRKKYAEIYHNGRIVPDRTIERRYKKFDKWAGLVFWVDMTKDWYMK